MRRTGDSRHGSLIVRWILTASYAAGIFVVSSMPGDALPHVGIGDKLLHALLFAGLAVFMCRALRLQYPTWTRRAIGGLAILATIAYGCLDEAHQGFVSGRQSEWADVLADGVGAAAASWGWSKARLGT